MTYVIFQNMGVSKNRGIPKWMVKIMENPIKMDDLGGKTLFLVQHPYYPGDISLYWLVDEDP